MEYRIKKIKDITEDFKGLEGMEVLTYISPVTGEERIDGPIFLKDYDKYYGWILEETSKFGMAVSDNLEDFKVEFLSEPNEFIPYIFNAGDLEDLGVAEKKDIEMYNEIFSEYFKKAKEELEKICD